MGCSSERATIAVMGATGAGKSTFVNLVSQSNLQVSDGLESCTQDVRLGNPFLLDGKTVTLVDTPGFDDTYKSEADVLKQIAEFLAATYKDGRKLNGIIFLHRISDARMGGIAQKNFRRFRKLCGDHTLKNVVIVTTMWDTTAPEVAEKRERELAQNAAFFKPAMDKGAQMRRHDNTLRTSTEVLRTILGFPPEVLRIQYETVDEGKALVQTDAGRDLIGELQVQATKHRAEIDDLKRAMREAAESQNTDQMQKIQELNEKLLEARTELEKVEDENRELREESEGDKRMSEEKMRGLMEAMNKREADVRRLLKDNEALQARLAEEGSRRARAEEILKRAVQGRRDGPGSVRKGRSIFSVVMEAALSFWSKRR